MYGKILNIYQPRTRRKTSARWWVMLALVVQVAGTARAAELEVRDIRIGIHPDSTRFVLDLSGETKPRIFGLADPFRIVIDLPEVNFVLGEDQSAGGGSIASYRYGLFRPGTSRVVLDLKRPAKVQRQFLLRPENGLPWRLVVDLTDTDPQDFLAAMRPQPLPPGPQPRVPPLRTGPRSPGELPVVVIDPGHGGIDPGGTSAQDVKEKTIVLNFGLELKRQLDATGRYKVVLTRDRDVFLPLRERVRVAREARADLFLSLHVNTNPRRNVRGFSVYTLSETASDVEAEALAAEENKSDVIGGVDLEQYPDDVATILIDLTQLKNNEQSVTFGRDMLLAKVGKEAPLLPRPWRSAGFAVLKAPDVPSVLLELGYLTHPDEAQALTSNNHRERLAAAIIDAIDAFFERQRASSPS